MAPWAAADLSWLGSATLSEIRCASSAVRLGGTDTSAPMQLMSGYIRGSCVSRNQGCPYERICQRVEHPTCHKHGEEMLLEPGCLKEATQSIGQLIGNQALAKNDWKIWWLLTVLQSHWERQVIGGGVLILVTLGNSVVFGSIAWWVH